MVNLADKAPGVYVFERQGTPPIAGVGTSTAAFVGQVADDVKMPLNPATGADLVLVDVNKAVPVTNFQQFKNSFGEISGDPADPLSGNRILAHAVFGFFLNGGTKCYVIRVPDLNNAADVNDALDELEKIDEIAIVVAPGARNGDVQTAIVDYCEKIGDRFAILDGQDTTDIQVAPIQGAVRDSNYAALYFPDISVSDQTPGSNGRPVAGARLSLPPSGHMAGIYARVDFNRGVHKAPANEFVRGALGLDYQVTANEQGSLNKDGINVIRNFNGNIKVWGARTLGGDDNGEFKYINVRRLFLFLRESIDEGTQFAVFEPNAPPLWQQIIRAVSAFLTIQWRNGALFGNSPEEAFFVQCDEETNPPEIRAAGQVVTKIGVAVVFPAEFVVFEISQKTQES